MPLPADAARQSNGPRDPRRRAWLIALMACLLLWGAAARAQGVEVLNLAAQRGPEAVTIDYQLRVTLTRPVEEAAQRGVPLYFVATATLWRSRWYWRDERVARARREWRLSYQPLTSTWRISQGGLGQSHASLDDAMAAMTRSGGWRIADASQAESDGKHYVEFDWQLDLSQLPRPLQIGLTGVAGGGEWNIGVERQLKLDTNTNTSSSNNSAKPDGK
jgi:hypothetical protein